MRYDIYIFKTYIFKRCKALNIYLTNHFCKKEQVESDFFLGSIVLEEERWSLDKCSW